MHDLLPVVSISLIIDWSLSYKAVPPLTTLLFAWHHVKWIIFKLPGTFPPATFLTYSFFQYLPLFLFPLPVFFFLDFLNHLMLWLRFWSTPYFLALKNSMNSEVSKILSQVLKSWLNKTWNCMFNISIQIIIKRIVFCVFKTDPFSLFHSNALLSGLPVFVTVTFFYLIFKAKTLNSQLTPFLLSSTLFLSFSFISYTHVLHIVVAFTTAKKL